MTATIEEALRPVVTVGGSAVASLERLRMRLGYVVLAGPSDAPLRVRVDRMEQRSYWTRRPGQSRTDGALCEREDSHV